MQCVLQACWLCVFRYSRGTRKLTVEAEDGVSADNEQVANSAVSAWAQYQRVLYLFLPLDISGSVLPWDNFTGHLVHPLFWRLLLQPAYSLTFLIGKTFWGIERLPLMNGCDFPNANPTINPLFSPLCSVASAFACLLAFAIIFLVSACDPKVGWESVLYWVWSGEMLL